MAAGDTGYSGEYLEGALSHSLAEATNTNFHSKTRRWGEKREERLSNPSVTHPVLFAGLSFQIRSPAFLRPLSPSKAQYHKIASSISSQNLDAGTWLNWPVPPTLMCCCYYYRQTPTAFDKLCKSLRYHNDRVSQHHNTYSPFIQITPGNTTFTRMSTRN